MQHQSTPSAQRNSRLLRRGMTDSERLLWSRLRAEQLGVKFRRQHPLGHYVADFACLEPKLIVELDGSQHQDRQAYDARRDAFFREQGFAVLRISTNVPMTNLEGLLTAILEQIAVLGSPPPQPSPNGGGSKNRSLP